MFKNIQFKNPNWNDINFNKPIFGQVSSGFFVAYSLRQLEASFTGDAIKVRRSSDNAEQNIPFLMNGNLDQVNLTTFVGAGDGFTTTIYDQSGNGIDVFQTDTAKQPQIVSSGTVILQDGNPALVFDGTDDSITSTASLPTPASQLFIFIVLRQNVLSTKSTNFNFNSPNTGSTTPGRVTAHLPFDPFGYIWDPGSVDSDRLIIGGQDDTVNHQITLIKIAGTDAQKIRQDGIELAQRTQGTTSTTLGEVTIGDFSDTAFLPANMNWQEMIFFTSDETANITAIESDQKSFYGTP